MDHVSYVLEVWGTKHCPKMGLEKTEIVWVGRNIAQRWDSRRQKLCGLEETLPKDGTREDRNCVGWKKHCPKMGLEKTEIMWVGRNIAQRWDLRRQKLCGLEETLPKDGTRDI